MLSYRRRDKFSKIAGMNAQIVSSRLVNCNTDVEERTEWDRAFHVDAAADWKDRSPMVYCGEGGSTPSGNDRLLEWR